MAHLISKMMDYPRTSEKRKIRKTTSIEMSPKATRENNRKISQ